MRQVREQVAGNPPDDWPALLATARNAAEVQRFAAVAAKP
jgi:hypothetical protein